ncbi:MAG: hypothetical protein HC800_06545 [Phormidesmis sp. RL_2_1]|nr:hypothetical protein [Phormidesmis sp. RL_2_1]
MVIGFWLVSMLGAAMAIEGLISPKRLTMDLPEPTSATTPAANTDSFLVVEQSSDAIEANGIVAEGTQADAPASAPASAGGAAEPTASDSHFPAWSLGVMVGTCAAGCLVMSRRRAMARMALARARGRVRKVRTSTDVAEHSQPPRKKVSAQPPAKVVPVRSGPARLPKNAASATSHL